MSSTRQRAAHRSSSHPPTSFTRIAVGVDGLAEGEDAVALGAMLADITGADVELAAVHPDPLVVMPEAMNWTALESEARALLDRTRDAAVPDARVVVETGFSVPYALERVVTRDHCDLLVVGSSRHAPEGQVRIGKRTRQLLGHARCALAIAPHGWRRGAHRPQRVGVALLALSHDVDLLVLGSRRWGPAARLLLGSTGEAVARGAACPLLIVPREPETLRDL